MKTKIAIIILIAAACLVTQAVSADAIKVYLPREVTITGEFLLLGDVAIILGTPEDVAKASAIKLGKFSVSGQKIVVSRITILSRLTANKIASRDVKFTGARNIKVGREELTVSAKDMVAKASEFLDKNKTNSSIASYKLIRNCRNVVLESQKGEITFVPRLGKGKSISQVVVDIDVMQNGKKTGTHQVAYRPMYNCRMVLAKADMPAGTILEADNIEVKTIVSKYPERKGWVLPVGLVAKRDITSGQQIRTSQLAKQKPKILIKRNSLVVIKVKNAGFSVTADGKALGDGAFGEMIRVKNIGSERIISCKVNYDGTVSPAS